MEVFKRGKFSRWQNRERMSDAVLCRAVHEMEHGLVDADLGGLLFKKRIARSGAGKRDGYRTLVSRRYGQRYVFLHGYAKNEHANVSSEEAKALRFAGQVFLELSGEHLRSALRTGVLLEVLCEEEQTG